MRILQQSHAYFEKQKQIKLNKNENKIWTKNFENQIKKLRKESSKKTEY